MPPPGQCIVVVRVVHFRNSYLYFSGFCRIYGALPREMLPDSDERELAVRCAEP